MYGRLNPDLTGWPKPCQGGCGRLLRPPHSRPNAFEVKTVCSVLVMEAWCYNCRSLILNREPKDGGHHNVSLVRTPKEEEEMILRLRNELKAFWMDRRRRGVPEDGVLMEGEQAIMAGGTPFPVDDFEQTRGSLYCKRDHPYVFSKETGRKYCPACKAATRKSRAKRKQQAQRDAQ